MSSNRSDYNQDEEEVVATAFESDEDTISFSVRSGKHAPIAHMNRNMMSAVTRHSSHYKGGSPMKSEASKTCSYLS